MKKLSTILAAGTMALTLSTPVLAGPVGISRSYADRSARRPDDCRSAASSEAAQREARTGNKDNPAFGAEELPNRSARRAHEGLGEQVSQNQVDEALQPVRVW